MWINLGGHAFETFSSHSHYEGGKLGLISVYHVYVAVYGRANDQNMVGEHTIRPRQLEAVTTSLKVSEELEPERQIAECPQVLDAVEAESSPAAHDLNVVQQPLTKDRHMAEERHTLEDSEEEIRERLRQQEILEEERKRLSWEDLRVRREDEDHRQIAEIPYLDHAYWFDCWKQSLGQQEILEEERNRMSWEDLRVRGQDEDHRQIAERSQLDYAHCFETFMQSLDAAQKDDADHNPLTTSGQESKVKGDADNASDLDSSLSEQADDEDPDLLTIGVEPERTWLTIEDMELRRIGKLATQLRKDPLLPLPPANGEPLLQCEGLNFPLVHCAFENCAWVSDSRPCLSCTVGETTWPRHVAGGMWCELRGREQHHHGILGCCGQETCLKQHIVDCHSDALLESCGEAELHQPFFRKGKTDVRSIKTATLCRDMHGTSYLGVVSGSSTDSVWYYTRNQKLAAPSIYARTDSLFKSDI